MATPESDMARFEAKMSRQPDGCWIWHGATTGGTTPYGKLWLRGAYMKAHRASYVLHVGAIPDGMCVCHTCDTPLCVNPEHLFLGTKADNAADMLRKGRGGHFKNPPRGNRRKDSKLTETIVADIRARYANGESQSSIGRSYGIQQSTVHKVVHRIRWAHV